MVMNVAYLQYSSVESFNSRFQVFLVCLFQHQSEDYKRDLEWISTWNFPVLAALRAPSFAASARMVDDASSNSRESICTDDPTKLANVAATSCG